VEAYMKQLRIEPRRTKGSWSFVFYQEIYNMIPAPAATAANWVNVLRHSTALLADLSTSNISGMTATVPTYRNVPAVNGNNKSPHCKLVPARPITSPVLVAADIYDGWHICLDNDF